MKLFKKSIATFLIALMLLTCAPLQGFASVDLSALFPQIGVEEADIDGAATVKLSGTCGDNVTYKLYDSGLLVIEGSGNMFNYNHGNPWKAAKTVEIKNGVTSIGNNAFYLCEKLTSITIPNSVTSIGSTAFYLCEKLTNITLPKSLKSIGQEAFYGCTALTSITIPDGVTSIAQYTFCRCENLSSITIPKSVKSIGQYAFFGCNRLRSVTIPDGVTSIEAGTFSYCGLSDIVISDSVTSIGENAFSSCAGLRDVIIPESVTSIGSSAFFSCYYINSITILNRKCKIYDSIYTIEPDVTIIGYKGSTAQSYAQKYGNIFEAIPEYTYKLSKTEYTYSGKVKTPVVSVTDPNGKPLTEGTDYTVTYTTNRKSVGEHKILVTLKGSYSGEKVLTYYVLPKATEKIEVSSKTKTLYINWEQVKGADGYRVYIYKGTKQVFAKNTTENDEYTVKGLKPGTKYRVSIKAYITTANGDRVYSDKTTSVYTATKPLKVTLSSVTAGTKQAELKWESTDCTSYQIRYSTDKDFDTYETVTVKGESSVSKTISSLRSGKTYYFKVRAYKSVNGVKYCGNFSPAKSVKIK